MKKRVIIIVLIVLSVVFIVFSTYSLFNKKTNNNIKPEEAYFIFQENEGLYECVTVLLSLLLSL